ncbi:hypothetical protein [Aliikangiella coralliicola]|uniref:CopL family metal-binding regulatory protein n=1 Tax=Aliikangiella coralliicola TaxID=2592383 RepID=A0A545U7P3_9GAMM|nr:hypothetical protein [Aliikangiella coralliicola]TQV85485.1 hypothetical protein FLL46_20185 [Aliikangiella coralliicola]
MSNRKSKLISVMLVLLSFVGQVVASKAVHCRMELAGNVMMNSMHDVESDPSSINGSRTELAQKEHVHNDHMHNDHMNNEHTQAHAQPDHKTMDHQSHSMTAESQPMDCCQLSGDCSMGACATAFLIADVGFDYGSLPSQKVFQSLYLIVNPSITTHFRPPILA